MHLYLVPAGNHEVSSLGWEGYESRTTRYEDLLFDTATALVVITSFPPLLSDWRVSRRGTSGSHRCDPMTGSNQPAPRCRACICQLSVYESFQRKESRSLSITMSQGHILRYWPSRTWQHLYPCLLFGILRKMILSWSVE